MYKICCNVYNFCLDDAHKVMSTVSMEMIGTVCLLLIQLFDKQNVGASMIIKLSRFFA